MSSYAFDKARRVEIQNRARLVKDAMTLPSPIDNLAEFAADAMATHLRIHVRQKFAGQLKLELLQRQDVKPLTLQC